MINIIKYIHHGTMVSVHESDKGKHRDHCLCWQNCRFFNPDDREKNCSIANGLYEMDISCGIVTPVWECPRFDTKKGVTMSFQCETSNAFLEAILITALEGAIIYWCDRVTIPTKNVSGTRATVQAILDGDVALYYDIEDNEPYPLDKKSLLKGLQLYFNILCQKDPELVPTKLEDWDYDADDADAIIQCSLFGKIIFG